MRRMLRTWLAVTAGVVALALLLLWVGHSRPLLAGMLASGAVPELVSYQGTLSVGGAPYTGTATLTFAVHDQLTGGAKLWEETHTGVPVANGVFAATLGSQGQPLGASVFGGAERYLQLTVDTGSGPAPLPRQRFHAVPYALRAYAADTATTAQTAQTAVTATSAVTATYAANAGSVVNATNAATATYATTAGSVVNATYATTATYALNAPGYAYVVVVAKSGGDYTSVADALADIADASSSKRYLVWVAPGVYDETGLVDVKSYVHLQGAGRETTVIRSSRSSNSGASTDPATAYLRDYGRISDLTILNSGTASTHALGILVSQTATRTAEIDNVTVKVNGAGGNQHYAVYAPDGEPAIRRSWLSATGATGGGAKNVALYITNALGGSFSRPLIEDSTLLGAVDQDLDCNDSTGTGYGAMLSETAAQIRRSYICGPHRGIAQLANGQTEIHDSILRTSSTAGAYLFESTGTAAIKIAGSQLHFVFGSNKLKPADTGGLACIHNFRSDYQAASNGVTAGAACN